MKQERELLEMSFQRQQEVYYHLTKRIEILMNMTRVRIDLNKLPKEVVK